LIQSKKSTRCGWVKKAKNNKHEVLPPQPQKPGLDYNDTFAPIGNKVILILLRTFARPVGYELVQLDIETAYIHGNLKETV
jgi:hypothetical protein